MAFVEDLIARRGCLAPAQYKIWLKHGYVPAIDLVRAVGAASADVVECEFMARLRRVMDCSWFYIVEDWLMSYICHQACSLWPATWCRPAQRKGAHVVRHTTGAKSRRDNAQNLK